MKKGHTFLHADRDALLHRWLRRFDPIPPATERECKALETSIMAAVNRHVKRLIPLQNPVFFVPSLHAQSSRLGAALVAVVFLLGITMGQFFQLEPAVEARTAAAAVSEQLDASGMEPIVMSQQSEGENDVF